MIPVKLLKKKLAVSPNAKYPFEAICFKIGRVTAMLRRAGKNSVIEKAFIKVGKEYNKDAVLKQFKQKAAFYEYACGYKVDENKNDLPADHGILQGYLTAREGQALIAKNNGDTTAPRKHQEKAAKQLIDQITSDVAKLEPLVTAVSQ